MCAEAHCGIILSALSPHPLPDTLAHIPSDVLVWAACRLLHSDSPAHEGYPVIPPVLRLLTGLKQVELHVSSGQNAQLDAAAAIPDVQLVLTLARHEQVPFSR